MTREEAIKTLKDRIEQYTGGVHPGEREILLEAFAVLRPTPDPVTGLLPCGCGGVPRIYQSYDGLWLVQCDRCSIGTLHRNVKENAISDWNFSRGLPDA